MTASCSGTTVLAMPTRTKAPAPSDEDLLTVEQVSEWLHVPVATLVTWRSVRRRRDGARQGPEFVKIERRVFYQRKAVLEYIAAQTRQPGQASDE